MEGEKVSHDSSTISQFYQLFSATCKDMDTVGAHVPSLTHWFTVAASFSMGCTGTHTRSHVVSQQHKGPQPTRQLLTMRDRSRHAHY